MSYSLNFDDASVVFNNNMPTILEASAGSGKTTILTERWIVCLLYLLAGEKKTVSEALGSMTALTFTRKAATEMKERIRKRLDQLWLNNELDDIIVKFSEYNTDIDIVEARKILDSKKDEINDLLPLSPITTINGFILQKLNQYPLETGLNSNLSPSAEGKDGISNAEIRAQNNILQALFEQTESEIIQKIFELGVSLCGFTQWKKIFQELRTLITRHNESTIYDALENSEYMIFNDQIKNALDSDPIAAIFDMISPRLKALISALEQENAYKRLSKDNNIFYQNLCHFNKEHLLSLFSKEILGKYKLSELKDTEGSQLRKKSLRKYQEFIKCQYQILIPLIIPISQLCSQKLNQIYHENNQISFSESEYLFLDLLKNPLFSQKVCGNMRFLFVDEFQDTSDIQKEIFNNILSHDPVIPFFVGDPKQSIYSFRKANVQVFYDTQREFEEKGFSLKRLETNYRSGQSYVQLVNHLFQEIFDRDSQNIVYFPQKPHHNRPSQFLYTCTDVADTAFEQALQLIHHEIEQGTKPGNIIILLQKNEHVLLFQKILKEYLPHIPFTSSSKDPLWISPYVAPLIRFLRVLVMPQDNFLLVALLKTEFFRKSDPEIDKLIQKALQQNISLYDILDSQDQEIIAYMALLRDRIPLDQLIDQLIKETEYDQILQLYPNPGEALASVYLFLSEVQGLQEKYPMSLYEFLNYIDENPNATDTAEFSGEAGKTLRIMTVHSAKGLEADCIFYIHKDSSRQKKEYPLFLNNKVAFDTLGKDTLAETLSDMYRKEQLSEQKRLAYVALTRAKDKFYFCGLQSIVKNKKNPEILHDKTWSAFFNRELVEKFPFLCNKIEDIPQITSSLSIDEPILDENIAVGYYQSLKSKTDTQWNHHVIPQFLSVTQLLDAEFAPEHFLKRYKIRNFNISNYLQELDEESLSYPPTAEMGSILHHVLQNFDMPDQNELKTYLGIHYPHINEYLHDIFLYSYGYWNSEFYQQVYKNSTFIHKEHEVSYLFDRNIIIRATADIYLMSQGKRIITDYKLSVKHNLERYHRQLSYYALLFEYAGYPIDELVLFDLKEEKDIKLLWSKESTTYFLEKAVQTALELLA